MIPTVHVYCAGISTKIWREHCKRGRVLQSMLGHSLCVDPVLGVIKQAMHVYVCSDMSRRCLRADTANASRVRSHWGWGIKAQIFEAGFQHRLLPHDA